MLLLLGLFVKVNPEMVFVFYMAGRCKVFIILLLGCCQLPNQQDAFSPFIVCSYLSLSFVFVCYRSCVYVSHVMCCYVLSFLCTFHYTLSPLSSPLYVTFSILNLYSTGDHYSPLMMAAHNNVPFQTVDNDESYDTFQSVFNADFNNRSSGVFHESVVQSMNSQSKNLDTVFDPNDDTYQHTPSFYYTESLLATKHPTNDFLMLHCNIRSANKNFEAFRSLLLNSKLNCSVIGLSETWFTNSTHLPYYSLPGYDLITNNRTEKAGGGVGLYVSQNYEYELRPELNYMSDFIETLFAEIIIPGDKNILVGIIYRPPNTLHEEFLNGFNDLLAHPYMINKKCFLLGDYNANLLKYDTEIFIQNFMDVLLAAGFLPLITKPTRISNTSATLIDNVFTNARCTISSGIILSDLSDHFPIFSHFKLRNDPISNRDTVNNQRDFSENNMNLFKEELGNVDWSVIYSLHNASEAFDAFMNLVSSKMNSCFPIIQKKRSNYKKIPRCPWITSGILRSINRKNNLYLKSIAKPCDKNKKKYSEYKNLLTCILRRSKKMYFCNQFDLYKKDVQNTWKVIKNVLQGNPKKSTVSKINLDGEIIDNSQRLVNVFNDYFVDIGPNLASNIPDSSIHYSDFLKDPNPYSIYFTPTDEVEIAGIIRELKNKHSSGHDSISNVLLKKNLNEIVKPLTHICNLSISTGVVPTAMKLARVIPIFKKGDNMMLGNYRPISLLTCLSKVLEKIVFKRTSKFLNTHKLLYQLQFGFREKHCTTHAMLTMLNKITSCFDRYEHTVGVFLDFSKAFDTINHDILLYKLSYYGIRGIALEWFRNYLLNRQQYVSITNVNSNLKYVTCGVPQGSILGPLLFLIYINDFCKSSDVLSFILFADDSSIFYSHKDPHILTATVNQELKGVSEWIKANKLSLNLQKTYYMVFSNIINELPSNVVIDCTNIQRVTHTKFLGITIDEKLSWKVHIDNICKVISRNIGVILNKVKFYFPTRILLNLYSTLILPHLNYGIIAWGSCAGNQLNRILLLQKKALRVICLSDFRAHTDALFLRHKILKINDLYSLNLGIFMYNLNSNELPDVFYSMFTKNYSIHHYPTRSAGLFHFPKTRTMISNKTFLFTGPKLWNSLSETIRNKPTIHSFSRGFKKSFLQTYTSCLS